MKQVLQDRKSGKVEIVQVPVPERNAGQLLVRVQASVISAGTESALVAATGRSLMQRVADKPDLIRKGFDTLKARGFDGLKSQIEGKYAGYEALGYSCAGVVVESDPAAAGVTPGTRVACGGIGYANHAEFVSVPHRLCAVVPEGVDDSTAAYATLGAIAMQGVRQSAAVLGEHIVVIGLGLVGLLAAQLLKAAGCSVSGIDPSPAARARGLQCGCTHVAEPGGAAETVLEASRGLGADAVLICAATESSDPVLLAGELARSRGRVVMVGSTGMEIPRELYFRKELTFALSRSYGPGRYDTSYEEAGVDYPADFVRFTEQRNMQSFLDLAARGAINVTPLTTHRFPLDQASQAYAILADRSIDRVGIVLNYPAVPQQSRSRVIPVNAAPLQGDVGVGFIGAGGYAEGVLLPLLRKVSGVSLRAVATRQPAHAASVATRFGFATAASGATDVLADPQTKVVFIATRHDSHASYAIAALEAKKHVWVEKPLALNTDDLQRVVEAHARAGTVLAVGFNRRLSFLSASLLHALPKDSPLMVTIRVNAGHLPADHWTQNPATGGGRLLGEGCHFLDYLCFLAGSDPETVSAAALRSERPDIPASSNFTVTVTFKNGSVGQLIYTSEGSLHMPKERIEVFGGGVSAVLDDFMSLTIHDKKRSRTETLKRQDKGQDSMLRSFIESVRSAKPFPLTPSQIITSTTLTLAAQVSLDSHKPVPVDRF